MKNAEAALGRAGVGRLLLPGVLLGLLALLAVCAVASAQNEITVNATVTPLFPKEGELVLVVVEMTNPNPTVAQTPVNLIVFHGTSEAGRVNSLSLPANSTRNQTVTFTAKVDSVLDNERGLIIQVQRPNSQLLGEKRIPEYHVKPAPPPEAPDYLLPVVLVIVIGAGGAVALFFLQRRKAEQERIAAEAAAKASVEARVAAESARELAATQKIHGKYPAEFYYRKRLRLAVLVPHGLTSSGTTILARLVKEEKKIVYSCPRCGTHKESFEAPCPRCAVQDSMDALRAEVHKHRGTDFSDVTDLIQQAEFQLSYSSFEEAQAIVDQGRQVFNEILAGGERTIQIKRIETISAADGAPKRLELGVTEHTTVDTVKEEQEYETREEYARQGQHCPTCGHAMYGDLCANCHFDDYVRLVEDAIQSAALAGADTVEPRDLLDRGKKMREEGNKSTASRYLNRARYLAKKHAEDHFAAKAEGMIDYTRTLMLVGEEDGIKADFGDAERLIDEADAKRAAGSSAEAIDLVKKAEDQIQEALHQMAKQVSIRRIDEAAQGVDDARAKGVKVEAAEKKLQQARASFDAGEFERARDETDGVRKAVVEAAQGKAVCPKCGKPVQPTWARCPFCTTPLK